MEKVILIFPRGTTIRMEGDKWEIQQLISKIGTMSIGFTIGEVSNEELAELLGNKDNNRKSTKS